MESNTTTHSATIDYLFAGEFPREPGDGTLITGQNCIRGAVLGKIGVAIGTATADAGNTGDGAISGYALAGGGAQVGTYVATCVLAAANGGSFDVVDPSGNSIGTLVVGVTFVGGGITVAVADGAADFIVGDSIDMTVTAGSDKLTQVDKTAVDGSQNPYMVLMRTTDATSADEKVPGVKTGDFNIAQLSFAAGTVYADVAEAMESRNMYGHNVQAIE
jgi:hypothetical protein